MLRRVVSEQSTGCIRQVGIPFSRFVNMEVNGGSGFGVAIALWADLGR